MSASIVDLNSDLGESFGAWRLGDDAALLDLVSSANVACGFHAGDPSTLRATVAAAALRGVSVGAQVSYPDLAGFGRRRMDIAHDDLVADVLYQIGALSGFCRSVGIRVGYVKPHGALYNRIVDDPEQAAAVVEAVTSWGGDLALLTLPGSVAAMAAESSGVRVIAEGFADRAYGPDGRLVPRTEPGAVLTEPAMVAERARRLVVDGLVEAVDGRTIRLDVDSLCVHGDTAGAVSIAREVRKVLEHAGVTIQSFA